MFKDVRLRALLDSPSAFGSTHAKEVRFTDEDWKTRAAQWNGDRSVGYLAVDGRSLGVGIVAGFLDADDPSRAHLVSIWVAPDHRQHGVGRLLVSAVCDWARGKAARTLHLMVTSNNEVAAAFYRRLAFTETGRTEPYPNDSALVEHEMVLRLEDKGDTSAA